MDARQTLHELLYVSVALPATTVAGVVAIINAARHANRSMEITGVLVFDGERFCQFLEGGMKEVVNLFQRITNDNRHDHVEMLHQGSIPQRAFRSFSMGYSYLSDVDVIGAIGMHTGRQARAAFFDMRDAIYIGI